MVSVKRKQKVNINLVSTISQKYPTGFKSEVNGYIKRILKLKRIRQVDLNVVLVSDLRIKKLNKMYRGKNKVTDVLSFTYDSSRGRLSGDIIICLSFSKKQAKQQGLSWLNILKKLVVHGLVHLLGYDHQTESDWKAMQRVERSILGV